MVRQEAEEPNPMDWFQIQIYVFKHVMFGLTMVRRKKNRLKFPLYAINSWARSRDLLITFIEIMIRSRQQ